MANYLFSFPYDKRIRPLLAAQFFGVLNDNAFKMFGVMAVFGQGEKFFRDTPFLLMMTLACAFPYLLLSGPIGAAADHVSKRAVMILSKFVELALVIPAALVLIHYPSWGSIPIFLVMFLLTAQSAFFTPAAYGIIPETFSEHEVSRANGDFGMVSFVAAILGISTAPVIKGISDNTAAWIFRNYEIPVSPYVLCALVLALFALIGIFYSMHIYPAPSRFARIRKGILADSVVSFFTGFRTVFSFKGLAFAVLGEAFMCGFLAALQILIVVFATYILPGNGGELEAAVCLLSSVLGIGIGCWWTGFLSHRRIELGLIPVGAVGFALFLPLAVYLPGSPVTVFGAAIHPFCLLWFCCAGISSGIFIVPLRAYFQYTAKTEVRGSVIACSNFLTFSVVVAMAGIASVLGAASTGMPAEFPQFVRDLAAHMPVLTVPRLISLIGFFILGLTVATMIVCPWLFVRFMLVLATRTLYKLRIIGMENLPESGPALLVANHVSFIDSVLISSCTSRKIRFLMQEEYYENVWIKPFAKMGRVIKVPAGGRYKLEAMFDCIKQALRDGEVVCVFPEGKVTRNGIMGDFKAGYSMMFPEGVKVPLIPVHLGMIWGSMFSYYYGKIRLRMPSEIPYPASVSFGTPLKKPDVDTAFQLRQAVSELGAESEMISRDCERTIHYQVAKNAKRHPFRRQMADKDGKMYTMFSTLVSSVLLSRELRALIPDSTQYVGVLLPNTSASALSILGILMADKVPAPLNFTASAETLRLSIEKAGMTHIITSRKFLSKIKMEPIPEMVYLEDIAKGISFHKKIFWTVMAILLPHQELMNIVSPITHRDLSSTAVLLFSSGSTGIPKGVLLSHHNINGDVYSILRVVGWTRKDSILGSLPLFHSFGFTTSFWVPLCIGSLSVYVTSPLDYAAVGGALEQYKLTIMMATPTFIQAYIKRCTPEQFASLRLAIVGAEKLRIDTAAKFTSMTGGRITLIEGYGCTELSPIVSINVARSITELGRTIGKEGSIGLAMPGICVKIVDPVTREALPPDSDGLMLVKGPNVMKGYLDAPELTENVIHDGWYETGDIARMDVDGFITISGRLSRFSKIGGEMVPHELLECVMNEINGLDERAVAIGSIPDALKGEALAVLCDRRYFKLAPADMNAKLRERNIPNLWIPKTGNYRMVDTLPVLGNGKLDLLNLGGIIKETFRQS